jgi:hypothetical protein
MQKAFCFHRDVNEVSKVEQHYSFEWPLVRIPLTVSTIYFQILERFQSKTLRMIVNAPWYVPNTVIRRDLQIPTVKEELQRYSSQY